MPRIPSPPDCAIEPGRLRSRRRVNRFRGHRALTGVAVVAIAAAGAAWSGCGDDAQDQLDDAVQEAQDQADQAIEEAQQTADQAQQDADQALEEAQNQAGNDHDRGQRRR
jgi:hypothetical protein